MRKRRMLVLSIGVLVVVILLACLIVSFFFSSLTVQKTKDDAINTLKQSTSEIQDAFDANKSLLDRTSDEQKESNEYLKVNEMNLIMTDIITSANATINKNTGFSLLSNNTNISSIQTITSQINNYIELSKSFYADLEDVITTYEFDAAVQKLRIKITDATSLVNLAKPVLGQAKVKSLSDKITDASKLFDEKLSDEDKVKANRAMQSQINDLIEEIGDKMETVQTEYDKKVPSKKS